MQHFCDWELPGWQRVANLQLLPGTAAFAADCLLQAHTTPLPRLFLVELTQHHASNRSSGGNCHVSNVDPAELRPTAEALHRTRTHLSRSISEVPLGGASCDDSIMIWFRILET